MTGPQAGPPSAAEAAYEEFRRRQAEHGTTLPGWRRLAALEPYKGVGTLADWALIARAAAEAYMAGGTAGRIRAERDRLRDGITELLADVTRSADAGGVHAAREHDFAIALRTLLEEP